MITLIMLCLTEERAALSADWDAALALAFAPDPVVKVDRLGLASRPARGEAAPMGPQRSLQRLTRRSLAGLGHNALVWFLAAWLVSYTATNALSVMFAVAMVRLCAATLCALLVALLLAWPPKVRLNPS